MFIPAAKPTYLVILLTLAAFSLVFSSCAVKDYPRNKPFVFQTNIKLEGKYSAEEKKSLEMQLEEQLHDSIQVRRVRKVFFWNTLRKPPVFDTNNVAKSRIFMNALLNSMGYYRDSISSDTSLKIVGDQYRTTVNFTVIPGKQFKLDSVWYNLPDSAPRLASIDTLQQLTINSLKEGLLKRNDPFSKTNISAELDRLTDVYRNNGYLRFSKEQLLAVWDTVGMDILRPTFDPIEQARQLEALRQRRENPTADLEIRLKTNPDLSRMTRYYVGTVKIYTDFNVDTSLYTTYQPHIDTLTRWGFQFISLQPLFKPRKLIRFIELRRGELYAQTNYLKTQNKFNSLGAWRLVTVNQFPRQGEDTVDFELRLIPADKYHIGITTDVSKNQGNITTESSLIGLGANLSLLNRNFQKAANLATTNVRYGVELSSNIDSLIQTQQFTLSHTIQFPRMVPRTMWLPREARENARTLLSINLGYTDRINYYNLKTVNTSWGYEFTSKNTILSVRFPNIEYNKLKPGRYMDTLVKYNKSYKYIFNDGLIVSGLVNVSNATGNLKRTTLKSFSVELAGMPGFITTMFPNSKLYHFIKLDAEVSQTYKIGKSSWAWRIFGGLGNAFPFSRSDGKADSSNFYLPFFRQYYAGGPNSMRGWSVRKLGPGSAIKSFSPAVAPDRFGDMRLEANGEYRFYITPIFGFPLEGALFTDIGNVWFLRKNPDFVNGEFNFGRLWKDLGVDVGYGLRWDFGFLKARFDFAYKAKDPSPDDSLAQNKWFYDWTPGFGAKNHKRGVQFQLGINYPF